MIDPRMTAEDLDDGVAQIMGGVRFRSGSIQVKVRPNFLTVELKEQGDPNPTTLWIRATDVLEILAKFNQTYGN